MWAKPLVLAVALLRACDAFSLYSARSGSSARLARQNTDSDATPLTPREEAARGAQGLFKAAAAMVLASNIVTMRASLAEETPSADFYSPVESIEAAPVTVPAAVAKVLPPFEPNTIKLPYSRNNVPFADFVGKKATIIFNMKIDDPQTVSQFPQLTEIFNKYSSEGLNVLAFPTEQGWFEPDDDETCRAKAKEFFGFGQYPAAVVFDKVDILGPSASPLFSQLTKVCVRIFSSIVYFSFHPFLHRSYCRN
jgi:glutathione peroxidase